VQPDFAKLPADLRFAAAVAGGAQLLRHDGYIKSFDYDRAIGIAENATGADPFGYRREFIQLLQRAERADPIERLARAQRLASTVVTASPNIPVALTTHEVTAADYPPISVRLQEQGTVDIRYLVQADGSVSDCEVEMSSGKPRLDAAACNIAKRWLFRPATVVGGVPVQMWLESEIQFQLR